jgi:diacylglycerol kinase (ATP)
VTSRVAVLRNPLAGRGAHEAAVSAALAALAGPDRAVEVLPARTRDEALAAVQDAVAGGVDALVVVGGDGTVHVGLQAVAGSGVGFGVIAAGTGNDFAQTMGVPADPVAAAYAIVAALEQGRHAAADLACIEDADGRRTWFGGVLACGFDALVNERANAMRWPKGRRRYDIAILLELARFRPRRYRLTFDDGTVVERPANLVAVANMASYGGGMRMAPDASATDGLLDVVVAGPVGRLTLLRLFPRVFQGTHVQHKAVTVYRTRSVRVEADGIVGYADGERTSPLPITVTVHPDAVRVLA